MADKPFTTTLEEEGTQSRFNLWLLLPLALLVILAGILGFWFGLRQFSGPGANSPEAGFARDMMTHHAQAVDMATLIRDRSDDPDVRQVALDILLTQQAQIGQMSGWMTLWGYPIASTEPAMAWMDMPTTGRMPGMASPEEMNQLRELHGSEAEELFLRLMITHHQSGVRMAEAALERARSEQVRVLAESMVTAQTYEIALMQDMLEERGFAPAPDETEGEMDMGQEHP